MAIADISAAEYVRQEHAWVDDHRRVGRIDEGRAVLTPRRIALINRLNPDRLRNFSHAKAGITSRAKSSVERSAS